MFSVGSEAVELSQHTEEPTVGILGAMEDYGRFIVAVLDDESDTSVLGSDYDSDKKFYATKKFDI